VGKLKQQVSYFKREPRIEKLDKLGEKVIKD
jgi:hypothetical protein